MWTIIPQFMKYPWLSEYIADCDWVNVIYRKMGGHVSMIPQDCCRMLGVACHDGHVIAINWSYHKLNGYIPPDIVHLISLRWL